MSFTTQGMAPLLQVFDMGASLRFYCDVLGFEVAGSDGKPLPQCDWVLLRREGTELMLNTAYEKEHRPAQPDPARLAAHDDVCLYFACPDVDAAYDYLHSKGLKLKPPKVAWYGMKQLYFSDPDGYQVCLQWRAEKETVAS
jgi:glyoxylase I family protein